ncbi:hypothetical protein [Pseudomonas shirazensis]|uniref:hypothetical protein n=1 Tax=Pseudomonas shirazensis TaxID=2745494 RepID=UPI001647B8EA|nr:hypothetical protein [Pseudomonas shirazensis]MBV4502941.1 hypothetical protein [Pseudomonas shirazensis]
MIMRHRTDGGGIIQFLGIGSKSNTVLVNLVRLERHLASKRKGLTLLTLTYTNKTNLNISNSHSLHSCNPFPNRNLEPAQPLTAQQPMPTSISRADRGLLCNGGKPVVQTAIFMQVKKQLNLLIQVTHTRHISLVHESKQGSLAKVFSYHL